MTTPSYVDFLVGLRPEADVEFSRAGDGALVTVGRSKIEFRRDQLDDFLRLGGLAVGGVSCIRDFSNKELAFKVVKHGESASYMVPDHGVGTLFNELPPVWTVTPSLVQLHQRLMAIIPSIPGDLARVQTVHTIGRDGVANFHATVEFLQSGADIVYGYSAMLPLAPGFDRAVSDSGETIRCLNDGSRSDFTGSPTSFAAIGPGRPDHMAAMDVMLPPVSLRAVASAGAPDATADFWHRESCPKVYVWGAKYLECTKGTRWSFAARWAVGSAHGLGGLLR